MGEAVEKILPKIPIIILLENYQREEKHAINSEKQTKAKNKNTL
jgi:hypothetical protein